MTARRLASGSLLYYYQAAGKKIPLGAELAAAKKEWARLDAGGSETLFPAIVTLYEAAILPGLALGTRIHYRAALRNLSETFEKFALEQIEPQHVKAYMRRRSSKGAAVFERRVLSAFFNWARSEGHTKVANPCRDMKFSKAERVTFQYTGKRDRYVTDAEFQEVYDRGDDILKDTMELALLTGQRPGDVLLMTRQAIHDGELWIVQEKTGSKVGIKIEGDLKAVLERIQGRPRKVASVYMICDRRGQRVRYNALWKRFDDARGEADWQFRDIRAKAATDIPELKHAQQLLGHKQETTTTTYRRSKGAAVSPLKRKI